MFDWLKYLTLADELRRRPESSARRAAISRAYYAAYCLARNALLARNKLRREELAPPASVHVVVTHRYLNDPDEDYQEISLLGLRRHRERQRADYEDQYPDLDRQVSLVYLGSESIADWLQRD